jgi:hypothetical protein
VRAAARILTALAAALSAIAGVAAAELELAPYKDELFAYPEILDTGYGGDYLVVGFDQKRDVIDRDEKPDEKARPDYVSLDVKAVEQDLTLKAGGTTVNYVGVGKIDGGAKIVLVFVHGFEATRFDAVNDWRSGGNLNRIKNLMVRAGGVYLAPDFALLKGKAVRQVKALVMDYARSSPEAPVFLACASLGARICWALIRDPEVAPRLGGVLLFAAVSDQSFADSALVRGKGRPIPVHIAHGSRDASVSWRPQEQLFRKVKAAAPDYPIRFTLFETGSHRTPLRMTDWRLVLNWMLSLSR